MSAVLVDVTSAYQAHNRNRSVAGEL